MRRETDCKRKKMVKKCKNKWDGGCGGGIRKVDHAVGTYVRVLRFDGDLMVTEVIILKLYHQG